MADKSTTAPREALIGRWSPKNIAKELREIRSTLEVLEAAYFNIVDRLEARHTPYLLNMREAARLLGIGRELYAASSETGRFAVRRPANA